MTKTLVDGIGATTGPALALESPVTMSGDVWYVSSERGTDAAAPAGKNREAPLATIGQAYTNAAAGDIIVLLEDHDETRTAELTIGKDLTIVGEGKAAGVPTAKLTMNHAFGAILLNVEGARLELVNVKFEAQLQGSSPSSNVHVAGAVNGFLDIRECYFKQGQYSGPGVQSVADDDHLSGNTYVVVSTTVATRPQEGLLATGDRLVLENETFDGGTVGFKQSASATTYGYSGTAGAQSAVRFDNISLLRGADMGLHASTTGRVNVATATSGARLVW